MCREKQEGEKEEIKWQMGGEHKLEEKIKHCVTLLGGSKRDKLKYRKQCVAFHYNS